MPYKATILHFKVTYKGLDFANLRTELIIMFTLGTEEGISTTIRITKSVTGHGPLSLIP